MSEAEDLVLPPTATGGAPPQRAEVALVLEVSYERPLNGPVIAAALDVARHVAKGVVSIVAHPDAMAEIMGPKPGLGLGPGGRHRFQPGDRLALQAGPGEPLPIEAQRITQGQIRLILVPRDPGRDLIRVYKDGSGLLQVLVDMPEDGVAGIGADEHEAGVFAALVKAHNALDALLATFQRDGEAAH